MTCVIKQTGPKHSHPLHIQSMDLTGNYVRELGSMRWAEVVAVHAQIQFLSLAENMIGHKDDDAFLALAYAASASQSITVMDLTRNFSSSECKTVRLSFRFKTSIVPRVRARGTVLIFKQCSTRSKF